MNRVIRYIVFVAILALLTGCSNNQPEKDLCANCEEYEVIAGYCPSCSASLCNHCLSDAEQEVADVLESEWEDGYEMGAEEGYKCGYNDGDGAGYPEGYSDGYNDGTIEAYGQGYADALMGKEYAFEPDSYYVWVPDGTNVFHKFVCETLNKTKGKAYDIETALVLGYQFCEECIGK